MRIAIGGISLGLVVMLLSIGIIRGFKTTIKDKLSGFSGDMQINAYHAFSLDQKSFILKDPDVESKLAQIPGVNNYIEFANKVSLLQLNNISEPVMIKGVSDINKYDFVKSTLISGKLIDTVSGKNEILISKYLADKFKISVNSEFLLYFADQRIKIRKVKVSGIYETGIDQIDRSFLISDLNFLRSVNDWDENITGAYQISLKPGFSEIDLQDQINDILPVDQKVLLNSEVYPDLYDWIGLLDVNAKVIIILMLMVAGINMISALLILILERSSFIGILKALGAGNKSIRKIFAFNASYLILTGLAIGNVISIAFYIIQNTTHIIKLDQQSYYMSYVPINLQPSDFLFLNLGTFFVCLIFVFGASLLITRISPLKAIKFN